MTVIENLKKRSPLMGTPVQTDFDIKKKLENSGLFDPLYYRKKNKDKIPFLERPIYHYLRSGIENLRDPSDNFSLQFYKQYNQSAKISDLDPITHFLTRKKSDVVFVAPSADPIKGYGLWSLSDKDRLKKIIVASGYFDSEYYLTEYPDVAREGFSALDHFVQFGDRESRNPGPHFFSAQYKLSNPGFDVSQGALRHFLEQGWSAGAIVNPVESRISPQSAGRPGNQGSAAARPARSDDEQARHDLNIIRGSELFDEAWYSEKYPEAQGKDAALHYLLNGAAAVSWPSPFFDTPRYFQDNPDVAQAGLNPLLHWIEHGRHEGRTPPAPLPPSPATDLTLLDLCDPRRDERGLENSAGIDLTISVLTPIYNTDPRWLRELYQTLRNQTYPGWEWVVSDDGSTRTDTIATLRDLADRDPRVKLSIGSAGGGISVATNRALANASGDYVALVDHDDLLSRDVLAKVREAILARKPETTDILYTDECKIGLDEKLYDISLKPAWSPAYLENTMYMGHLGVYRTSFVRKLGGFRPEFDGTQDYDLALRASRETTAARVVHVACIGYLWRAIPGSTASTLDAKDYAVNRQKLAVEAHARARAPGAKVRSGFSPGFWIIDYPLPTSSPFVSYVIPTAGGSRDVRGESVDLIRHCLESLEEKKFYNNCEAVVIHNGDLSDEQLNFLEARPWVKLVEYKYKQFNLAEKINLGVQHASGDYVCLLNDDVEAITYGGGASLIAFMEAHPEVGATAPLCIFEDGRTQHNGVLLLEQGPSHSGIMHGPDTPGHFGNLRCRREAFGVTGAMLFVRKALYEQLGGFDEKLPLNYNDVDFCLRLRREGYSCVVDPNVRVYHFESASKVGTFRAEKEALFSRWPGLSDPYFNAGFVQRDPAYVVASSRETAQFSDATTFERWLDLRIGVRTSRKRLPAPPLISVGVSVYNQPVSLLREMMASFTFQTYPGRELVILDNGSSNPATLAWIASVAATPKVRVLRLEENAGIAGGQRALVRAAKGDWFVPIDSDDFLTIDALRIFAERMQDNPQARIFYSDEFKSDPASNKFAPFFKPDFDAVSISNCCYPGHLMAMKMDLLKEIDAYGDDRATWCHDWDTTFRSLAAGETPVHVPEQLYAWRINPGSTASAETGAKPEALASQVFVLERALADRGVQDKIRIQPNVVGPNTGMWTLDALTNVDASILDATMLWLKSDRPQALLREAARAKEWVTILLAPGAEAKITDLLALSAVAHWDPRVGVVSGALSQNDGKSVLWSGGLFTAQGVSELSYGQNWADGGYYGRLYLQRCVDVAAPVNVLIKSTHLLAALDLLKSKKAPFSASRMMIALGVLAAREDWLVAITPVLRPALPHDLRSILPTDREGLLRQLGDFTPTSRWYGAHLSAETHYVPSDW